MNDSAVKAILDHDSTLKGKVFKNACREVG